MRRLCHYSLLLMVGAFPLLAGLPQPARGQVLDSLRTPPVVQEGEVPPAEVELNGLSPRGAFIRSALVPGWGHAEVGALVRGAFFFSVEATAGFMVFKSQTRLTRTRNKLELREAVVT